MIDSITILGGRGRSGEADAVERIELGMGDVVSVVGPTGSGKTTLINDLELFADANTPSARRVLIDGAPAPAQFRDDPARNPIALITQHTTFLSDLPVRRFLETHLRIRGTEARRAADVFERTLVFANELTGEPIDPESRMTELSGRPDAGAADRRRDARLRHADRAARRGRERRHPPDARPGAAAGAPEDLHLRHPRPPHRPALRLPDRDARRRDHAARAHERGRAPLRGGRDAARRRARPPAREDPERRARARQRAGRHGHEALDLRGTRRPPARPRSSATCCAGCSTPATGRPS